MFIKWELSKTKQNDLFFSSTNFNLICLLNWENNKIDIFDRPENEIQFTHFNNQFYSNWATKNAVQTDP